MFEMELKKVKKQKSRNRR